MANDLNKNVSQIVLEKFLPGFMSNLVVCKSVDRQLLEGAINPKTGDSVQFKRPHQYQAHRTPTGDLSGITGSELVSATATARIRNYITVKIPYSQIEQAIELNQWEGIIEPAYHKMISELETELTNYMLVNASLNTGTTGSAISQWGDVAGTKSLLTAMGADGECYNALNPWAAQDLADTQAGLGSGDNNLVNAAWKDAMISRNFGGVMAYMANSLSSYTTGTASGSVTVDATPVADYPTLKDTYQMTISLSGLGAGETITAGTQLEFPATLWYQQQNKVALSERGAGVPFTGTVTADATADGAGDISVVISGAAIKDVNLPQYDTVDRAIASGDTVNILGAAGSTYQPGLFYTKGFVGLGTVDLPKLNGWDSSVVNEDGFSIRSTLWSDGNTNEQFMRLDMLPSFCVFNPLMGGHNHGV